ncbi:MAG: Serine/threonine exchanger SteT [Chlorobi bacterium]|nr:MAG: amino acid permease [Bacteroidota bacterium]KXK34017.1 MAG: amino acid permease-associated region [Chlorobi bacterium OLB6]MBV6463928.1 Serine/threonine exchanger SteT [Chlorobiota bacterium]MBW7853964.1 amino acid permease [Candidatus Kapabacteria bacterium]WKZ78291.1 MAG: amino acid permease [Candidatus Kapabacteria bacterium]
MTPKTPSKPKLSRSIGLFTTTMLVVGSVVGSGIFKNPAGMAALVESPFLLMLVWVVAGVVTCFGALSIAEVAGLIPATGGQYEFFRVIYGDAVAFVYGWCMFFVIQTGSIASITYVFSYYFGSVFPLWTFPEAVWQAYPVHLPFGTIYPLQEIGIKVVTASAIIILTVVNIAGIRQGGGLQNILTVAKVLAILFLVAAAFVFGQGSWTLVTSASIQSTPAGGALLTVLVLTLNKALWAYDGWNTVTAVAGETLNPQRTIPRALLLGSVSILGIYILINLTYLYTLGIEGMSVSESVAADVARIALGPWGLTFVAVMVMISTLGTSNGTILQSARIFYAMAADGLFFKHLSKIHEHFRSPSSALLWQCVWSCVLVFTGTFDMLTEMLIFVSWGFYGLAAFGVFVLRRRMPHAHRPYKTWGYPAVPALFVLFAAGFLVFSLYADYEQWYQGQLRGSDPILNSVYGVFIVISALPAYVAFRKMRPAGQQ